jgi:hypothetical protein
MTPSHAVPSIRVPLVLLLLVGGPPIARRMAAQARVTIPKSAIAGHLRSAGPGEVLRIVKHAGVDTVRMTLDSSVSLRVGDVLVVPAAPGSTTDTAAGVHVDLENRYIQSDATGQEVLTLSVRIAVAGGGLRYDPASQTFVGTVFIGLEDSARHAERLSLSRPIDVQVTGDAESVEPVSLRLTHTNVPFDSVRIRAGLTGDVVHLLVQPTFDPNVAPTPIPVVRPSLIVHVSPEAIPAFALQSATITISAPRTLSGQTVVISADRGALDTNTLTLSPQGVATTKIRSGAPGVATVRVEVGDITARTATLRFSFPWSFIIASVLGSLVGALIRSRRTVDQSNRAVRVDVLLGLAYGLLGAVAYTLGLNLVGVELSVRVGDAATFVVSALAAALDLPGLAKARQALA